jgi:methylated-DNA-[protein]-cysteine S-methyltransferase
MTTVVFQAAAGWMGVRASEAGLVEVVLPKKTRRSVERELGTAATTATDGPLAGLVARFRAYFNGEAVEFPDQLDLSRATPFQRSIWETARRIPRGETRSYTWVAERVGRPLAVRAAGGALGKNPLPVVVPCHRVIAADGSLGGFSGGLAMKRKLLDLESNS